MDYFYQTLGLLDNQDGRQNDRHLTVYTCGHSNLVIYHPISSKFHIWTTFKELLFISEYVFCQMNDYQDFRQMDIPFRCWALGGALCRSPTDLVLGVHKICLIETGLLSTHNICFD